MKTKTLDMYADLLKCNPENIKDVFFNECIDEILQVAAQYRDKGFKIEKYSATFRVHFKENSQ